MSEPSAPQSDHELSILYEIASIAKHIDSMETVYALTLDKASRLLGAEIVLLYVLDSEEELLHIRAAYGVRQTKVVPTISPSAVLLDPEHLPSPLDERYPVRAKLSLPIIHDGALLGWLFVARLKRDRFEQHEVSLYTMLVEQVASALQLTLAWERNARQQANLAEANHKLQQLLAEARQAYQQQEQLLETVRALSTPVLLIDRAVLLIPLIGQIDVRRIQLVQERVLAAISEQQAEVVIVDITGVAVVDQQVVVGLLATAQAAQLLGASVIICGVTPDVAQAIVSLGLELHMRFTNNLRAAIALATEIRQQT